MMVKTLGTLSVFGEVLRHAKNFINLSIYDTEKK